MVAQNVVNKICECRSKGLPWKKLGWRGARFSVTAVHHWAQKLFCTMAQKSVACHMSIAFIGKFFVKLWYHTWLYNTHIMQSGEISKISGGEPLGIFRPRLADMFPVSTAVTGKIFVHISLSVCKYDMQMHVKMPFPMGWSHATLNLKVFRSEFGHEILHK